MTQIRHEYFFCYILQIQLTVDGAAILDLEILEIYAPNRRQRTSGDALEYATKTATDQQVAVICIRHLKRENRRLVKSCKCTGEEMEVKNIPIC